MDPDIEAVADPNQLAMGVDPQIERAIKEIMRLIEANPPRFVEKPAYQDRSGNDIKK